MLNTIWAMNSMNGENASENVPAVTAMAGVLCRRCDARYTIDIDSLITFLMFDIVILFINFVKNEK